jgi:hypothetical protein
MFVGWQEGPAWVAAGWTMIHFLWIGAGIGLAALIFGRGLLRNAPPQCRMCYALGTLLLLTATAGLIYQRQFGQALATSSGVAGDIRALGSTTLRASEQSQGSAVPRPELSGGSRPIANS